LIFVRSIVHAFLRSFVLSFVRSCVRSLVRSFFVSKLCFWGAVLLIFVASEGSRSDFLVARRVLELLEDPPGGPKTEFDEKLNFEVISGTSEMWPKYSK
jgi:hypothetical protein